MSDNNDLPLEDENLDALYSEETTTPKKESEGFFREDAKKPTVERVDELAIKQGIALTYGYTNHEEVQKALTLINNLSRENVTDEILGQAALLVDNGNLLYPPQVNDYPYQSRYVGDPDTFLMNRIPGKKESKRDIEILNHARRFDKSGTLSGSNAVLAIAAAAGRSGMFEIPLVNSGIRVVMRAPKLKNFTALEEQLGYNKGQLGRSTLGYIFTHLDTLMTEQLYNFIFEYIEVCNVKNWRVAGQVDTALLRRVIKLTDLYTLVNGLLSCYYPEGHNLVQPCTNIENNCTHIEKAKVHFPNMFWVNNTMLDDSQITHMTNSIKHAYTEEEIHNYQSKFEFKNRICGYDLPGGSKFEFEFDVPSLDIHTGSGGAWIKGIESLISAGIQNKSDEVTKRRLMGKLIDENDIKLYSSWIKSLTYVQDDGHRQKLDTYSDIVELIEMYSDDIELVNTVVLGIWDFIEYSNVVVIGIPSYRCPKCGGSPSNTTATHPTIIPVNIIESFFTLLLPSMSKRIALI